MLMVGGILTARSVKADPMVFLCLGTLVAVLSLAILRYRALLADGGFLLSIFLLGLALERSDMCVQRSQRLTPASLDERILACGIVESEPSRSGQNVSLVIAPTSVRRASRLQAGNERIMVRVRSSPTIDSVYPGTEVRFEGIIDPFPAPRNPGEFDYGRYLELNDVHGLVSVRQDQSFQILQSPQKRSFAVWVGLAQESLYRAIDSLHRGEHSAFLKGVILGYRADLSEEIKQSFMDTGTVHILAVSGSNVAFVALLFYSLFGLLRLPQRSFVVATLLGLVAFMFLTGSSASVVRATVMAAVLLLGSLWERRSDLYNSLAVAAVVLLLWNPTNLFDVGFQLSFAAVLSIVYFYPHVMRLLRWLTKKDARVKALDPVLKLFAVSVAAQIGTIPFTAYYFGRVSLVSVIANLVVVPVSGLNTMIGFVELGTSLFSDWLTRSYAAANDFLVWFVLGFVRKAAAVPLAYVETAQFGPAFPALYYGWTIAFTRVDTPKVATWLLVTSLLVIDVLIIAPIVAPGRPVLRVTAMDVGQGDALEIVFPNGTTVLIDAGPRGFRFDAGERVVSPYLRRSGHRSLASMLLTHPHGDHLGGAAYLLGHFPVRTLAWSRATQETGMVRETRRAAIQAHVPSRYLEAGDQISPDADARLYVLSPKWPEDSTRNLNNASVVAKLQYGTATMLLVGDAEVAVERNLLHRVRGFLRSDVLKLGHHGGSTSSSVEFLRAVNPRLAVISVATRNKFGHPSPEVLARCERMGTKVLQTNMMGAVVLETDGRSWDRRAWRDDE